MRLFQQHHSAFTLIELLITVAIAAIVVGGSIAGFVRFNERQEVQNTAKEVQQLMRNAQSKARVREVPDSVIGERCEKLISYHVGNNNYTYFYIQPHCETALVRAGKLGVEANKVLIPTEITVSGPIWVRFTTLENGVTFEATATAPYEYRFENGANKYKFSISANGNISNVEKY